MSFRYVDLDGLAPGRLALAAMPGRFEPWPAFVADAAREGIALVLSLAPRDEIAMLAPPYFDALAGGQLPFRWREAPMRNFGLPAELAAFRDAIDAAAQEVERGDAVLLHCAAGIGRTGSAAACLLKRLGASADEAVRRVAAAGSNPESALQSGLIERF